MDALRGYDLPSSKLSELGFTANDYECSVFNKYVDGHQVSICIYADDLFVTRGDTDILDCIVLQIDAYLTSSCYTFLPWHDI